MLEKWTIQNDCIVSYFFSEAPCVVPTCTMPFPSLTIACSMYGRLVRGASGLRVIPN